MRAKLFLNGKSQAVRLPKEFRFKGQDVRIKKIGDVVLLMPVDNPWGPFIESLNEFSDDFMDERNQPGQQKREDL